VHYQAHELNEIHQNGLIQDHKDAHARTRRPDHGLL
jgi:hypothetical protein